MVITAIARRLYAKWRARCDRRAWHKHKSGWDNPTTGTDLLELMVQANRRKKDPLP